MEKFVSMFQNVIEVEQYIGVTHKNVPLAENGNPYSMSNKEHGIKQFINSCKGVEINTIAVSIDARADICMEPPLEKLVLHTGKTLYRPPPPSAYMNFQSTSMMEWNGFSETKGDL